MRLTIALVLLACAVAASAWQQFPTFNEYDLEEVVVNGDEQRNTLPEAPDSSESAEMAQQMFPQFEPSFGMPYGSSSSEEEFQLPLQETRNKGSFRGAHPVSRTPK